MFQHMRTLAYRSSYGLSNSRWLQRAANILLTESTAAHSSGFHGYHVLSSQSNRCFDSTANNSVKWQRPQWHNLRGRYMSIETYNKFFSPDMPPIGMAQNVLEQVHSWTGLPWWASIALTTFVLWSLITLPLAVYSQKILARVERLQPEIKEMAKRLKREVAMATKMYNWNNKFARVKFNTTVSSN